MDCFIKLCIAVVIVLFLYLLIEIWIEEDDG